MRNNSFKRVDVRQRRGRFNDEPIFGSVRERCMHRSIVARHRGC
jgi:hypothetical protein